MCMCVCVCMCVHASKFRRSRDDTHFCIACNIAPYTLIFYFVQTCNWQSACSLHTTSIHADFMLTQSNDPGASGKCIQSSFNLQNFCRGYSISYTGCFETQNDADKCSTVRLAQAPLRLCILDHVISRAYTHKNIYSCMCVSIYIHTHTHIHIHTYTYIYTFTHVMQRC
jgi:hypothetical protein